MPTEVRYTVKLYGHMSGDTAEFCRELAALLNTDLENATALVRDVPVILLQGVPKKQAEHMAEALTAIRALSLVEAEGGEPEPVAPLEPRPIVLHEPSAPQEEEEDLRSGRLWMTLLLGGLAVILIVGLVSFLSLFEKRYSQNRALTSPAKVDDARPRTDTQPAAVPVPVAQLEQRIEGLDKQIELLREQMQLKEQEIEGAMSSPRMDYDDIQKSRQELAEVRDDLRARFREMSQLKAELARRTAQGETLR